MRLPSRIDERRRCRRPRICPRVPLRGGSGTATRIAERERTGIGMVRVRPWTGVPEGGNGGSGRCTVPARPVPPMRRGWFVNRRRGARNGTPAPRRRRETPGRRRRRVGGTEKSGVRGRGPDRGPAGPATGPLWVGREREPPEPAGSWCAGSGSAGGAVACRIVRALPSGWSRSGCQRCVRTCGTCPSPGVPDGVGRPHQPARR